MKGYRFLTSLALLSPLAAFAAPVPTGASLSEIYTQALKRSETLATQAELVTVEDEHVRQAKGSILPTVTGTASYLVQEEQAASLGSTIFPNTQPLVKLTATQPVFRGLREFAALRQTRDTARAQVDACRNAALTLYKDVAQAYFAALALERDRENLRSELDLYDRRIRDLKSWVRIGRSRLTEVLSVESARSVLLAQLEVDEAQLASARETLSFLSGISRQVSLAEAEGNSVEPASLETYLTAIEKRPDVRTELARVEAAGEAVGIAKGAHLPSLDLTGNYYLKRTGSLKDVGWDVQAILSLPIYSGGVVSSKVREFAAQENVATLSLSRVRRAAEQEIRTLHQTVLSERKQRLALEEVVRVSHQNYLDLNREYRLGLATNLDVLQALTSFEEGQRSLDRTRTSLQLDFARLEAAAAMRPEPGLLSAAEGLCQNPES